ncbi:MAG: endo-1,4-beta-xylanase [Vicinamibacterales bacterium]
MMTLLALSASLAACGGIAGPVAPSPTPDGVNVPPPAGVTLRSAAASIGKLVGAAVKSNLLADGEYSRVLRQEFNYLTAEYELKWDVIEPRMGRTDYSRGDAIVSFGDAQRLRMKGHALIWHESTPSWVEDLPTDAFRAALMAHIRTTVGRYRGRLAAWDVVNEAVSDGGGLRDSVYQRKLGNGYIAEAFREARTADPSALLFYNDYGAEGLNGKSNRVYELVRDLKAAGVPIDGVGLQMHVGTTSRPSVADIAANMRRLAALGVVVTISEMDVVLNGPGSQDERLAAQREVYRDIVGVCVREPRCDGVTFWGFTDGHTWLPGQEPLLFDAQYGRKPAYSGVLDALLGR